MPEEKPYFPAPIQKGAEPNPSRESTKLQPMSAPIVVTRPDLPPSQTEAAPEKRMAKLTSEEVRALLAVTNAQRRPWRSVAKRGTILVPVGIVSQLLQMLFGDYALIFALAAFIAAIVWIARPLRRNEFD